MSSAPPAAPAASTPLPRSAPGNPFARQAAALRQALLDSVTPDDLAAIAHALIAKAAKGDVAAARLVLSYTLGKPAAPVDPDRLDAAEWQGYRETAGMMTELPQVLQAPAPGLPLDTVRGARPTLTREMGQLLGGMLAEPEKHQPPIPDLELVDGAPPNGTDGPAVSPPDDDGSALLALLSSIRPRAAAASRPRTNGRAVRAG